MAPSTSDAVLRQMPGVMNGEVTGRGSNRLGWLHTLRSCIRMLMTLMKWPVASVSLVVVCAMKSS